jgi:hypothetical protein
VTRKLRAFGRFWYDFVVGDDWRVAVGVAAVLLIAGALAHTPVPMWLLLPLAVAAILAVSVWRAARPRSPDQ